jgi:hypothetical protein
MQLLQNQDFVLGRVIARAFRRGSAALSLGGMAAIGLAGGIASAGPFSDPGHPPESMLSWATEVDEFVRGPMDAAMPGLGLASFGFPENTLGEAFLVSFDVVSLGDGGWITLYFGAGIEDGAGDDFAVYENGFYAPGGFFGEFAFVEVSTNGVDFVRFAAESLQGFPVEGGEVVDPTDYGNFAGDQVSGLGTGFDLAELSSDALVVSGLLDLSDVRYVRIVDVVGDGSTLDHWGLPVYDPYPTAFSSGGFDLEAVGVLNEAPEPAFSSALGMGALALAFAARRRSR